MNLTGRFATLAVSALLAGASLQAAETSPSFTEFKHEVFTAKLPKTLQQKESIEKTKLAIEREEGKIIDTEGAKKELPIVILEMLETEQLIQWRKHPNTFFVRGVDKARIVFDPKKRIIFTR